MLRVGAFLLVGALALGADAAPRGRVVRVERAAAGAVPRRCSMVARPGEVLCFGQPRKGERIAIIDVAEREVRGELVIESAREGSDHLARGVCVTTGLYTVKGSYTGLAGATGSLVGLRGASLDRRVARVLADLAAPSGHPDEAVDLALDADGNGRADLVMTHYACDDDGKPARDTMARCFDTYVERHGALRRVHQDIMQMCR